MSDVAWDYGHAGPAKSHYRATTPGPIVPTADSPITPTSPGLPTLAFSSVSSLASSSSCTLASPVTPRTLPSLPSPSKGRRKSREVATAMELAVRMSRTLSTEEPRSPTDPFAFDDEYRHTPSPSLEVHESDGRPASSFSSEDGSSLETPTAASAPSQRRARRPSHSAIQLCNPPRRLPTLRKPTMPVELSHSESSASERDGNRKVEVVMTDVGTVELRWTPGKEEWLVPARVYILPQRFLLEYHRCTPEDERQWLISSALQLYHPMRYHCLQAESILRLSFPGIPINLDTPIPPKPSGMRRSTFTSKEPSQVDTPPDLDLRLIVSEPWRNAFRLSHRFSEDVWVPAGVEFDVTKDKVECTSPEGAAGSATLQRMVMHALRRVVGTTRRVGIDVQRAIARADLRRLSFNPHDVLVKPRGYGIVDLTVPAMEGVRLYFSAGGYVLEHAASEPGWRVTEVELLATELLGHIGVDIGPGPTLSSLPQLRAGFTRVPFTLKDEEE